MSVQCPHCGGDFQLEVKLTVPAVTEHKPQEVAISAEEPVFRVDTPAGKFRRALYRAGYHDAAINGRIYNDKLAGGRSRLKLVRRGTIDPAVIGPYLHEEFGDNLDAHRTYGGWEYVVYFWRYTN